MLVLRAGLKSSYGSLFLIGVFMSVWRLALAVIGKECVCTGGEIVYDMLVLVLK